MSNGMRIDGRELPLPMQEQAALIIAQRIAEGEEQKESSGKQTGEEE